MTAGPLTPIHQCYHLPPEEDVDPVQILVKYLVRNPQYARQRHPDCPVFIYVTDHPVEDRLSCPPRWRTRVATTIGAIRAAAGAITGEDFAKPPPTPEQVAARKARKALKKARKAEREADGASPGASPPR